MGIGFQNIVVALPEIDIVQMLRRSESCVKGARESGGMLPS